MARTRKWVKPALVFLTVVLAVTLIFSLNASDDSAMRAGLFYAGLVAVALFGLGIARHITKKALIPFIVLVLVFFISAFFAINAPVGTLKAVGTWGAFGSLAVLGLMWLFLRGGK